MRGVEVQPWQRYWTLYLGWILASATGGAVVGALEAGSFQFLATLVLTGFVLGITQAFILRRRIQQSGLWVLACAIGWFVGINATILLNGILDPTIAQLTAVGGIGEVFWLNVVQDLIILAVMGIGQWLVLRRQLSSSRWWILASAIGGMIKGAVGSLVCAAACEAVQLAAGNQVATAMSYGAGWAGYGVVTGVVLVGLFSASNVGD
ncbi:MAG: hypothetical protein KME06_05710 [Kastovskya adunca ATA6-11-RM4]|nr:hypothetical protein [Kastovskya adunca ATA6-11-RM4]